MRNVHRDEWAGLGEAYPDWMHDYNAELIRSTHANYIRWMHISPQAVDVRACDKAGIIEVCPAGDKEEGRRRARQWDQRAGGHARFDDLFPQRPEHSVLGGWQHCITAGPHAANGGFAQAMGSRTAAGSWAAGQCNDAAEHAVTPIAEYYRRDDRAGPAHGRAQRADAIFSAPTAPSAATARRSSRRKIFATKPRAVFGTTIRRRILVSSPGRTTPIIGIPKPSASPPPRAITIISSTCISNTDPAHSKWSGYASIYWSDSNADGRQDSSEVARVSGKVDSVRLPKQAYYVYRVMQNPRAGHSHHRPLDLSDEHGEDGLCRGEPLRFR